MEFKERIMVYLKIKCQKQEIGQLVKMSSISRRVVRDVLGESKVCWLLANESWYTRGGLEISNLKVKKVFKYNFAKKEKESNE